MSAHAPATAVQNLDVFRCPLDGISLVEASAGTGKTWNICGLYLRLLLERGLAVQQILVVTFTNAATAELRARIRDRMVETLRFLDRRGEASDDPFVSSLVAHLGELACDVETMRRQLQLALHTFDEAAIFTIHGFCQRALADAPFAAGLPLSMELVPDDADLITEAVQDFWRRHLADDALPPELAAYLLACGDTPERYARLLKHALSKPLATRRWTDDIDADASTDLAKVGAGYTAAGRMWCLHADEIHDLLQTQRDQLHGTTYSERAIDEGRAAWDALFAANDPLAMLDFKKSKLGLYRSKTLINRKKTKGTPPEHLFFALADDYLCLREQMASDLAASRQRLLRELLSDAGQRLREQKRARGVASFDDMLFNLYERLTSGACPSLAETLRRRFPAALIDEFQDTDPLQLDIFRSIYGRGEAALFLVGDPKQAIYSFRNADLPTYLQAKALTSAEYSLFENQRASEGLIHAVNALFSVHARAFMIDGLDFHPVRQGTKRRAVLCDDSEPRADLQLWMLPDGDDLLDKKQARAMSAKATAAEIARLINEARAGRIRLDDRPLQPGDMAVLVRNHAHGSEMKAALASLNVGSVELSQANVFQSPDADDVECVLQAALDPQRIPLLRAALATQLLGSTASGLETMAIDESRFRPWFDHFYDYRERWQRHGVGAMFRRVLRDGDVSARMLMRPDGERRLTNLLHLIELLNQAEELHPSPLALLRWFQSQRRQSAGAEASQLRLESDQNLVQIITVHKSKGLEYPVVFCPFLWDGRMASGSNPEQGRSYHDPDSPDGPAVIDLRGDTVEPTELDRIKALMRDEAAAETVRLIYVALTRAAQRCYLVAGSYGNVFRGRMSVKESGRSMLNWLVAGDGMRNADWFDASPSVSDISAAWSRLVGAQSNKGANSAAGNLASAPLPLSPGISVAVADGQHSIAALAPPGILPRGWRISSYSGISYGAVHEQSASDHDARTLGVAAPTGDDLNASLMAEDILLFPRGAGAGDCIHAMFELMDFADHRTWPVAIATALANHPQAALPPLQARLPVMLEHMAGAVMGTELIPGCRLADVSSSRRLVEMEFNLPVTNVNADTLNRCLKDLGYAVPTLTFGELDGFLKGFIDLVFEHDGRYYILDWKSTHLGYGMADYFAPALASAMASHGYHLQYLLYSVALHRYLRRRVPGYRYETHFGGVLYLFVRGVRPDWADERGCASGVFFHRPEETVLTALNALLDVSHLPEEVPA